MHIYHLVRDFIHGSDSGQPPASFNSSKKLKFSFSIRNEFLTLKCITIIIEINNLYFSFTWSRQSWQTTWSWRSNLFDVQILGAKWFEFVKCKIIILFAILLAKTSSYKRWNLRFQILVHLQSTYLLPSSVNKQGQKVVHKNVS